MFLNLIVAGWIIFPPSIALGADGTSNTDLPDHIKRRYGLVPPTGPSAATRNNQASVSQPALQPSRQLNGNECQALLAEGGKLTAEQARAIEADLKGNPANESQWARLLGFHAAHSSETNALLLAKVYARTVENCPGSLLLERRTMYVFSPILVDEKCFEEVASAWIEVGKRHGTNAWFLRRAGSFLTASPVSEKYSRQGEELLERAQKLEPENPQHSFELADHYLEKAEPRYDDPDGDIASAQKALSYLQRALALLQKPDRDRPEFQQKLTRAAFWAGEYSQATQFARAWVTNTAQLARLPAATENQRQARAIDQGEAIHDANMILGEIALSEGKVKEAAAFLIEAGKATNGWTLTSFGPDLALVKDLIDLGEREAALTFFDECEIYWTTGKDSLAKWKASLQTGQKPDFGPGFHYRFKRLKP